MIKWTWFGWWRSWISVLVIMGACLLSACPPESQAKPQHYVNLDWHSGSTPFAIYRNVNGGAFVTIAGNVNATTYQDKNVSPNKTYCYYVRNLAGQSNTACATIPNGPQASSVIGTVEGGRVE